MHLLLAEDDKVSRELLRRMLESEPKYVLTQAADGEEAWKLLSDPAATFDAGLFDIQMPTLDGLELAARIRGDARLARMPIILCTATNDRATVRRAAGLAVSGYLVKPFARQRVVELLDRIAAAAPAPAGESAGRIAEACERLGIDAETHRTLLQAMLGDLQEWSAQLRAVSAEPEFDRLLVRANGLKGACLSLGAVRTAERLAALRSALHWPPGEASGELEQLERELALLGQQVGAPVAA
jgi:CheY-like chemotaxis protein